MKKVSIYEIIAVISSIIRSFLLPNPFEPLGEGFSITVLDENILLTPDILNWIFEVPLHMITYAVVGIYYLKGSVPSIGSIFYLLFYVLHVFLLYVMSWFNLSWVAVITVLLLYITLHVVFSVIKRG